MILRMALFALMALGLLGFGAVAWISAHPPTAAQSGETATPQKRNVLVPTRDLRAGTLLKAEDITAKELPAAGAAQNQTAITDSPENRRGLAGGMLRRSLGAGDTMHQGDVMRPGDHGFLAAVLQPGMRAVTVGVDSVTGTAGLIWPGDRVDLLLTQSIEDAALPAGRRVVAETVLQNTLVIAIDQQLVQGAVPGAAETQTARTVTLEVSAEQAEAVQVASRIGRLSLAVRAAEQSAQTTPVTLPPPVWAGDVSPALTSAPAAPPSNILRVYQGADGKEFHF
jgi:pilus assembly protein CpaB